jgi:hypothetical protein
VLSPILFSPIFNSFPSPLPYHTSPTSDYLDQG